MSERAGSAVGLPGLGGSLNLYPELTSLTLKGSNVIVSLVGWLAGTTSDLWRDPGANWGSEWGPGSTPQPGICSCIEPIKHMGGGG